MPPVRTPKHQYTNSDRKPTFSSPDARLRADVTVISSSPEPSAEPRTPTPLSAVETLNPSPEPHTVNSAVYSSSPEPRTPTSSRSLSAVATPNPPASPQTPTAPSAVTTTPLPPAEITIRTKFPRCYDARRITSITRFRWFPATPVPVLLVDFEFGIKAPRGGYMAGPPSSSARKEDEDLKGLEGEGDGEGDGESLSGMGWDASSERESI